MYDVGRVFFVLTWLLMSGLVLTADAAVVVIAYRQIRATSFPTVEGAVTRSEVKTTRDGDERRHRLDLAYEYEVGGRRFTSTRYSYAEIATNMRTWHRVRDELPVGARVAVAYDPDDPAESLLSPGFTGLHLVAVWFLTPFNLMVLLGWLDIARGRRRVFDPVDPRTVMPAATGWRVRLPGSGRAERFVAVLTGVTLAGMFVWAVAFDLNPPVPAVLAGVLVAGSIALAAAVRRAPPWLEVDEVARVLRIPAKQETVEVPFALIRDVIVAHEEHKDSEGDVMHLYHCELIQNAGPPIHLATYNEEDAKALAAWLRERVGVPLPAAPA